MCRAAHESGVKALRCQAPQSESFRSASTLPGPDEQGRALCIPHEGRLLDHGLRRSYIHVSERLRPGKESIRVALNVVQGAVLQLQATSCPQTLQ